MIDLQQADEYVKAHLVDHLEELKRLCAQPSIAAQNEGMRECADIVRGMLDRRGFDTQVLPTDGFPVVYAERKGSSERALLFYNHYDVQPADPLELWDSPPFAPEIRDGKLYARGVSDDKGHILCRLAALDAILDQTDELPCTIKFLIEGEEEIGSVNLPAFIEQQQDLLACDGCIWEFGSVNQDGIPIQYAGLRGICYVELSVRTASQDAHSGLGGSIFPNAAWRLTWALSTLKGEDEFIRLPGFYDRVQPPSNRDLELLALLPEENEYLLETYGLKGFLKDLQGGVPLQREKVFVPTCTICGLTSGYQGPGTKTVLPAEAKAKVDFRLVPDQTPQEVLEQLREHLDAQGFTDVEITFLGGNPGARTDPDDPFLQMVVQTAEDVYGTPMIIAPMVGGSGPNYAFTHVLQVPVATAGVGYPESNAHAPNENLVIENFVQGVNHTTRIIEAFSQL